MLSVACCLRASRDFDAEYVERLRMGAARHVGPNVRFLALSDVDVPGRIPLRHDWPRWWCKIECCAPWIEGDLLYFDLDTILVGDCSELAAVGRLTMLSDFHISERLASGVMYLTAEARAEAWERWIKNPKHHMDRAGVHGDGYFFAETWGHCVACWQNLLPGQIVSYKCHVMQAEKPQHQLGNGTLPYQARVVAFHGKPRPRDIAWNLPQRAAAA